MNPTAAAEAIKLVLEERRQQDAKWGDQAHHPDALWQQILSGEIGALSRVFLHARFGGHDGTWNNAIEEATKVAAVAVAHLEALIVRRQRGDDL